jgi:Cu-processing system permease protein
MHSVLLVARRELKLLRRSHSARAAAVLLLAIAWLPPLLVSLRAGRFDLASYVEVAPLLVAVGGIILPLLALLAGADMLAGELEDGFLVPVVSLPISRTACFGGKLLGRALILGAAYLVAFGSAAAGLWIRHGPAGLQDYLAPASAGLLLSLACAGTGAALAASGHGRVRAYAASLAAWVLLVFVLDAGLLATVVGLAPPPPENIGHHGHDELSMTSDAGGTDLNGVSHSSSTGVAVLMTISPVDLFRLSSLTFAPDLGARWMWFSARTTTLRVYMLLGWVLWIIVPPTLAMLWFERLSLA